MESGGRRGGGECLSFIAPLLEESSLKHHVFIRAMERAGSK